MTELTCDGCGVTAEVWSGQFELVNSCVECWWGKYRCTDCETETSTII